MATKTVVIEQEYRSTKNESRSCVPFAQVRKSAREVIEGTSRKADEELGIDVPTDEQAKINELVKPAPTREQTSHRNRNDGRDKQKQ